MKVIIYLFTTLALSNFLGCNKYKELMDESEKRQIVNYIVQDFISNQKYFNVENDSFALFISPGGKDCELVNLNIPEIRYHENQAINLEPYDKRKAYDYRIMIENPCYTDSIMIVSFYWGTSGTSEYYNYLYDNVIDSFVEKMFITVSHN